MQYDARGRRVRKQWQTGTENYVYEGDQILLDVTSSSGAILRKYAWFPWGIDRLFAMQVGSDTLAALLDPRIGTVRALVKHSTGNLVKIYSEDPWGDAVADTGLTARYRFAGREFETESGLYYNRARYYDPQLGRFISEDPAGVFGGLNLYIYSANDPINAYDPSGLGPQDPRLCPGWRPCELPPITITPGCSVGTVSTSWGICWDVLTLIPSTLPEARTPESGAWNSWNPITQPTRPLPQSDCVGEFAELGMAASADAFTILSGMEVGGSVLAAGKQWVLSEAGSYALMRNGGSQIAARVGGQALYNQIGMASARRATVAALGVSYVHIGEPIAADVLKVSKNPHAPGNIINPFFSPDAFRTFQQCRGR